VLWNKPFFNKKDIQYILSHTRQVLESGTLSRGPYVVDFEKKVANYLGRKYAIATNSCTTALEIGIKSLGIKNSEIIVPTNTFIASPNSIVNSGNVPVFADIEEDSYCLNTDDIEKKITTKTKAIMVVHIGGLIHPKIRQIKKLCRDEGLFLIEDCAQAFGAMIDKKKAGTFGDVACFSFYYTKIVVSAEGGFVTTNKKDVDEKCRMLRSHGRALGSSETFEIVGNNYRMHELTAIIGLSQLRNIEKIIKRRNEIAKIFNNNISDLVIPQICPKNIRHVYYKFCAILDADSSKIIEKMKKKYKIDVGTLYYPPCHLHPVYQNTKIKLPIAEKCLKRQIALPISNTMTDEQAKYITESLKKELRYG